MPWVDIVTLQTLDEFKGVAAAAWRRFNKPVVMEEDRYEHYRNPGGDIPAWYRRFFWANIVSGAHATYGGVQYVVAVRASLCMSRRMCFVACACFSHASLPLRCRCVSTVLSTPLPARHPRSPAPCFAALSLLRRTWLAAVRGDYTRGVRGYNDSVARGVLADGARDLKHIRSFFRDGRVSMAGVRPSTSVCGTDTTRLLCASSASVVIVYATIEAPAGVLTLTLPRSGVWTMQCFNTHAGVFVSDLTLSTSSRTVRVSCALSGDYVMLLRVGSTSLTRTLWIPE
jgi:hypothetical protein